MSDFTHFNKQGEAVMVDVSEKKDTVREAKAVSYTHLKDCWIRKCLLQKGNRNVYKQQADAVG